MQTNDCVVVVEQIVLNSKYVCQYKINEQAQQSNVVN
jgi:hypothetical protein